MKRERKYTNQDMIELINQYIHSARDRDILIDRYINGLTFGELSLKYNLCDRQIKRIAKKIDRLLLFS